MNRGYYAAGSSRMVAVEREFMRDLQEYVEANYTPVGNQLAVVGQLHARNSLRDDRLAELLKEADDA